MRSADALTRRPGSSGVEHPSFVPASLLHDPDVDLTPDADSDRGGPQRSVRDWVVDVALFALAVAFGLMTFSGGLSRSSPWPDALVVADLAAGSLACLALWLRRRWPVGLALALAVIGTFSDMSAGAVLVSLFTVAVHRRWPVVGAVTAVHVAALLLYYGLRPDPDLPYLVIAPIGVVLTAAVVAWGMFVRARRQLVLSLRERARRAESEQRLRVEQARQLERSRIAREMHDVLAHRVSLLSMYAGALEFRPGAPAEELARAAGVIRDSAHQVVEDLREVVGVLRQAPDGVEERYPQPTLADLPALVEESRQAGVRVRAHYRLADLGAVPMTTGRNAYRIVQEGLTNVRKHAPGAVVDVVVDGAAGTGLSLEIRNRPPVGDVGPSPVPGGGMGLVGLSERANLAGGRLDHGRTPEGDFRLEAWLPWPP